MSLIKELKIFTLIGIFLVPEVLMAQADEAPNVEAAGASATSYTFDPDSYTRLRVTMDFSNPTGTSVFSADFCPEDDILGFSLMDLVRGDKSAALTVGIQAPQVTDTNLNLYNLSINRKLFGRDCKASFERIDFKSPLYLGGQYDGTTISITPQLIVADQPSQLFSDSLSGLIASANALSSLPAPFLNNKDKIVKRLKGEFSSSVGISDTVQLSIGSTGRNESTWMLPGDSQKGIPSITLRAYLENVSSFFTKPVSGWNASSILVRNFPSGAQFGFTNFGQFANGLGAPYTDLVAATDIGSFNTSCKSLQSAIAGQGFSPMDRSLILWAVTKSVANMKDNLAIDSTPCLSTTFAELGRFDITKDIVARSPAVVEAKQNPASERQMRATVEYDSRFASFLKAADWGARRNASESIFRWPLKYLDRAEIGLMSESDIELANSDQWQTRHSGGQTVFASKVGCYLFRPSASQDFSYMLAMGELMTSDGSKEAVVRLTFDNAPENSEQALVRKIAIIPTDDPEAELELIKSRHPSGCGGMSWKPSTMGL